MKGGGWLKAFLKRIKDEANKPTYGLHPKKQIPFFRIFHSELFESKELKEKEIGVLVNLTQLVTNLLENELLLSGFWLPHRLSAQSRLKGELQKLLLSPEHSPLPLMGKKFLAINSRIMELAKANNDILLYS